MVTTPEIFLDTSALFAAVWSSTGGGRLLLLLGESSVIRLLVSTQVLVELERAVRRKAPAQMPNLAVLLERSRIDATGSPPEALFQRCTRLTGHTNDALVLAAAWSAGCDYFVTLDKRHSLENESLRATVPFVVGTPGDCVAWLGDKVAAGR